MIINYCIFDYCIITAVMDVCKIKSVRRDHVERYITSGDAVDEQGRYLSLTYPNMHMLQKGENKVMNANGFHPTPLGGEGRDEHGEIKQYVGMIFKNGKPMMVGVQLPNGEPLPCDAAGYRPFADGRKGGEIFDFKGRVMGEYEGEEKECSCLTLAGERYEQLRRERQQGSCADLWEECVQRFYRLKKQREAEPESADRFFPVLEKDRLEKIRVEQEKSLKQFYPTPCCSCDNED